MMPTVLLVDDEQNVLDGLRRALRNERYQVICATCAGQALEILKSRPVDVVVSDQEMAGMKGTEFLARVNRLYPDTVRMMLTGRATLEVAVQALNDGAISRFFTKPCNTFDLAVTIHQALQHRRLLVQARRLLNKVQDQSRIIEQLEQENPGITHVKRDASGAIITEPATCDFDELMREIGAALPDHDQSHNNGDHR